MKPPKKRQKLCQNCDGEVDLDVIFCPYCGSDMLEEKNSQAMAEEEQEKTFPALKQGKKLYPPPYMAQKSAPFNLEKEEEEAPAQETSEKSSPLPKSTFWSVLLITLGVQALLLGILLFIFSEGGSVHLRFDAKMWLFYVVFSMPMLYFGWKNVSQIDK